MMRREYFPVLWFFIVACVVGPALLDIVALLFSLPEEYYTVVPAVPFIMVGVGCITFMGCMFYLILMMTGESMDIDTHNYLFGKGNYNCLWTFLLIPCAIFGYYKEAYIYAVPVTAIFIVFECIRTRQNEFARIYRNAEIAELLRKANQPTPREVHLE